MLARVVRREFIGRAEKSGIVCNARQRQHTLCFSTTTEPGGEHQASTPRRLRRLKPIRSRLDVEFKMPDTGGLEEAFQPDEEDFSSYLEKTSLSPWVPTPDPVARRVMDLLNANQEDIHVDLGCGDGRVCFHACDPPYGVKESIGIDVDTKIVEKAKDRLSKRHPKPNVQFIIGDLKDPKSKVWEEVANASVITMYFVKEALKELQPQLERILLGKKCRIATVGYAMPKSNVGWDPTWVEVVLGTPIHIYELGFPMKDRLTPPNVDEPVAGGASDITLQKGRQPFKDEYDDIERGENPLVDPDDFLTDEDEDWDAVPGAPQEVEVDDSKNPTWKKP